MILACGACSHDEPGPFPGCIDPPRGPLMERFRDVSAASGVDFVYSNPDYRGGALAVVDLDGDGLPDIVAGRRLGGLALYRNTGDLRFAALPGLDPSLPATAFAVADLDNDGTRDLVISGGDTAYVFANAGDASFREVARFDAIGVTEQILPVDLDGDGRLDLYFTNRDLRSNPETTDKLYMNHGAMQFQLAETLAPGLGWTATAFDYDGDGDRDLYIANDTLLADFGRPGPGSTLPADMLLRNDGVDANGAPVLVDIADAMGLAQPRSSMGGTLGDFDDDGQLDIYIPNLGAKKLFLRRGDAYAESAAAFGVEAIQRFNETCGPNTDHEDCLFLSWTAVVTDFDLDGYDELLVTNGMTSSDTLPPQLLFVRGPELPYHEAEPDLACLDARAAIATDLDGDGDQDLVIAPQSGPLAIYANRGTPDAARWQRVTLRAVASSPDGIGAVVTVHQASGRAQVRVVGAGGVINAASPAEAFFGLGDDPVETLEVAWPSGQRSTLVRPDPGALSVIEPP